MNKSIIATIVVLVIVFLGGLAYWYMNQGSPTLAPAAPATPVVTQEPGTTQVADTSTIPTSTPQAPATTTNSAVPPSPPSVPASATITYTDNGFSPANLMIAQGTKVIFMNSASDAFWPASNVHPTHSLYDGTTLQQHCADPTATTFDACGPIAPGSSWSFTFTKTGTWTYHNHLNPSEGGTITVQ